MGKEKKHWGKQPKADHKDKGSSSDKDVSAAEETAEDKQSLPRNSESNDASSLLGALKVGEVPRLASAVFLSSFTSLSKLVSKIDSSDGTGEREFSLLLPLISFFPFFVIEVFGRMLKSKFPEGGGGLTGRG